jgi:hypothetical protein
VKPSKKKATSEVGEEYERDERTSDRCEKTLCCCRVKKKNFLEDIFKSKEISDERELRRILARVYGNGSMDAERSHE